MFGLLFLYKLGCCQRLLNAYLKSLDEFIDALVDAFRRAVRRYIKPQYRYAMSLSGGLDSSVITAPSSRTLGTSTSQFPSLPASTMHQTWPLSFSSGA